MAEHNENRRHSRSKRVELIKELVAWIKGTFDPADEFVQVQREILAGMAEGSSPVNTYPVASPAPNQK
jgi:hypothetical protein